MLDHTGKAIAVVHPDPAQGTPIRNYLILVGLALVGLAGWLGFRRLSALLSGGFAVGTVIDHVRREVDESPGYHPGVVFRDGHGVERYFTSSAGWSSPRPAVGTQVKVVYLRSDPNVAFINSFFHLWAAPAALLSLAVIALVAGLRMT